MHSPSRPKFYEPMIRPPAFLVFAFVIWHLAFGIVAAQPSPTPATVPLTVNKSTGAIAGPVVVATIATANGLVTLTGNDTLSNKTLVTPVISGVMSGASSGATLQLESGASGSIILTPKGPGSGNEFVNVYPTNSTAQTDNRYGLRTYLQIGNGNTSHGYRSAAILGQVMIPASNSQSYNGIHAGLYGLAHHEGSGTMDNLLGQYLVSGIYGAGNASEGFGQYLSLSQFAGSSGRFVTVYGSYFAPFIVGGSGARPTNLYGYFFADNDGKADNVYAFYSAGNAPSRFSGAVTVGSLNTSGVISTTNTAPATGLSTGTITSAGGASFAKNLWLGQQLRFEAGSDNTIGINFGGSSYFYQYGAGNVRLDGANFYLQGDHMPTASATYDLGSSGNKWRQLFVSGAATVGTVATSAPTGGAGTWKLGVANTVSPTSPNRTITIEIGGVTYYLAAKTTND